MLGWNIQYGFNDSDFEVSENLLSIYLDEYEETPWDALKYLVSPVLCGQFGLTGLLQVRKWSPKKKKGLKDQEIVREFYFKSEKVDVLKKSQGNLKL